MICCTSQVAARCPPTPVKSLSPSPTLPASLSITKTKSVAPAELQNPFQLHQKRTHNLSFARPSNLPLHRQKKIAPAELQNPFQLNQKRRPPFAPDQLPPGEKNHTENPRKNDKKIKKKLTNKFWSPQKIFKRRSHKTINSGYSQHSADMKIQCSPERSLQKHMHALQHIATHCNTHITIQANTQLQHTATHCNTLQHTATYCNTLQHTATHCNTLQHDMQ